MSALSRSKAVTIRKEDGKRIEDETRRMEAKLEMLRQTMDNVDSTAKSGSASGSRWASGSGKKPIRGYVKGVLEQRPTGKTSTLRKAPASGGAATVAGPAPEGAVGDLLAGECMSDLTRPAADEPAQRGSAAANLQAAIGQQSQESQEVESFLAELKLDRYVSIFFENGFDSLDVVQEMQESHMREIGMAVGHIVKLQKKLAELRPQPKIAEVDVNASQRRVSFGGTETKETVKVPSATKVDSSSSRTMQEGDFDEAESAASFQEALRAWREGASKPAQPAAPGSFWSSMGGNEVDLQRCSTPVRTPTETTGVDSETQRDPAPSEDKICCYNCYKQFYKQFAVERSYDSASPRPGARPSTGGGRKLLCSEACADRWVAAMEEKAQAQRKRQEKLDALREAQRAFELQQGHGGEAVEVAA